MESPTQASTQQSVDLAVEAVFEKIVAPKLEIRNCKLKSLIPLTFCPNLNELLLEYSGVVPPELLGLKDIKGLRKLTVICPTLPDICVEDIRASKITHLKIDAKNLEDVRRQLKKRNLIWRW
jgi:hypothetical protein